MVPWAYPSPKLKWHLDQFSRSCTNDRRVTYTLQRAAPAPQKSKFTFLRGCGPHLIHGSFDNPSPGPTRHLDRFSRFCTDDRRVSLYFTMERPFPSKLPLPRGSGLHLIRGSLGPPKSSTQTASRSVQPFLQGSLV